MLISRRKFIQLSATAAGSVPFLGMETLFPQPSPQKELQVFIFSKALQFLDYREMCEAAKEMGFDGIDLTIRPKGHVLPERVKDDLPRATEAMQAVDLLPRLFTTKVTDAQNPLHESVLETASQQGYQLYRMGWFKYPQERTIAESLQVYSEQLKGLDALNKKLDLQGAYQNHAGKYMGAPIWDLHQLLEDISPQNTGCQYDIRHAVAEGGLGWETGLRLIKKHINSLAIKDFMWKKVKGKWKAVYTPLGEGMVDFKRYFSLLKKYQIHVPVSIHYEYDLGGAEHGKTHITMSQKKIFSKMKNDIDFLRKNWDEVE